MVQLYLNVLEMLAQEVVIVDVGVFGVLLLLQELDDSLLAKSAIVNRIMAAQRLKAGYQQSQSYQLLRCFGWPRTGLA